MEVDICFSDQQRGLLSHKVSSRKTGYTAISLEQSLCVLLYTPTLTACYTMARLNTHTSACVNVHACTRGVT